MNIKNLLKFKERIQGIEDYKKDNLIIINEKINIYKPIIDSIRNIKTLDDVKSIEVVLDELYSLIKDIKRDNDIDEFNKTGRIFDFDKLRKRYYECDLKSKFPKFDIEKYISFIDNPIRSVQNFRGETVYYDSYWINKNIIAVNQMIFNEMDLYILNIGKEGAGKSAWSSQQILYLFTFFSEVGLIEYSYDIIRMFFIDIADFLESHDGQGNHDYFRIECLDEGNQLNRQDYRNEENKQFKYEMRTERKMLRVIMINMQQLGELDTSISLSRVNFIYDCKMKNDKLTGLLKKGFVEMYIIPRGDSIYSEKYKQVFSRSEIINEFSVRLDKKKDYYISLPRKYIVKEFRFENKWGFDKEEYDDFVKDKMRERRFRKKKSLTDEQAYILLEKFNDFKHLNVFETKYVGEKKMYDVLKKFLVSINNYFTANPVAYNNIKKHYSKK